MTPRRDRARARTIQEIKAASLRQIEAVGAANLSLREVGRQIDMSVAGLYRYYDGRDALLTELIADAFADLAAAVSEGAASPDTAHAKVLAAARGYRRWSLDNPNRFMLIFGSPVPGYAAPEGGPTVDAVVALGVAWGETIHACVLAGMMDVSAWDGHARPDAGHLPAEVNPSGAEIRAVNSLWALVHGLVVLEVQNHFAWAIADAEGFFVGEVERWMDQLRSTR